VTLFCNIVAPDENALRRMDRKRRDVDDIDDQETKATAAASPSSTPASTSIHKKAHVGGKGMVECNWLAERSIAGILKQLMEKIDRTREVAGRILHRLLHHHHIAIPYALPAATRSALTKTFALGTVIDWSSPSQVSRLHMCINALLSLLLNLLLLIASIVIPNGSTIVE
jgi:hypothetical protein